MKLSEELRNVLKHANESKIKFLKKSPMIAYYNGVGETCEKVLSKVEKIEQQNKELLDYIIKETKEKYVFVTNIAKMSCIINIERDFFEASEEVIRLIEKITGKSWSEINEH